MLLLWRVTVPIISISMATPVNSINRVSINDLPESQIVKDDDFILLQSAGVSSKIQISNVVLDRENISFYNEIADLNRVTTENSQSIQKLTEKVDGKAGSDNQTAATQTTGSRVDDLKDVTDQLTTKTETLDNQIKSTKQRAESINTTLGQKIDQLKKDVSDTKGELGALGQDNNKSYTDFTSGISLRVTSLESKVASIESSIKSLQSAINNLK